MAAAQAERMQANCKIIWGDADYDIDSETDFEMTCMCYVKKDFGTEFGPILTMTGVCNSQEQAWVELDRILREWAAQVQSGEPMTKAKRLEMFGGPNGRDKFVVGQFLDELERRGGA